jgi:hypothetical protein
MSEPEQDVAAILEALRAEVRAARAAQGAGETGTALSAIERELQHCAEQLEITRVVSAHWPLEGRSLYERGLILVHKVVRRYLRWYINPIVEQQNAFNDAAARTLRLLVESHGELREQLAVLRRREGGGAGEGESEGLASAPPGAVDDAPDTAALQRLIEREGRAEPPAPLPDLGLRPLPARLEERAEVSAHWRLEGTTAPARAKVLGKRLIRQYLRWYVNPIVEQQNAANAAIVGATPHLLAADAELRARAAALRARRGRP